MTTAVLPMRTACIAPGAAVVCCRLPIRGRLMQQAATVPGRAWVVTGAGTAVNLCLGILYAWSVWKAKLLATGDRKPGDPMEGINAGWVYLSDAEATWAYVICGFTFALFM